MNWKTTASGIVAALAGFVLFSPSYFPPWAVDLAKYLTLGGLAGIGITAKDFDTHSTEAQVAKATTVALDQAVPPVEAPTAVVVMDPAKSTKSDGSPTATPRLGA